MIYRSTFLADMDITLKTLLIKHMNGRSLKKITTSMKKDVLGSFWLFHRLHGNILLRTLINFNFHFPTTLLIPQIAQFHLIICLLPVLNLLHLLSTSLLAYDLFVKFIQLFKSFLIVYSMTIFGKNFGFKICHFVFFSGS